MENWERVYTTYNWYDGPRSGVADYGGTPHVFENRFDEAKDDYSDEYALVPLDSELFKLVLEDWAIWRRWRTAFDSGAVDVNSGPALPDDIKRQEELTATIAGRLSVPADASIKLRAVFRGLTPGSGDGEVKWMTY